MDTGNFEDFSDLMEYTPVDSLLRPNIQGQTPLHVAAEMDDPRFVETLLKKMKLGNRRENKESSNKPFEVGIQRKSKQMV